MSNVIFDDGGMARPQKTKPTLDRARYNYYIGEWMTALGVRQKDVVKGTGINAGYLSQLMSHQKDDPSADYLGMIADFLNIPMDLLRRPPPPREIIEQIGGLDPAIIARLKPRT